MINIKVGDTAIFEDEIVTISKIIDDKYALLESIEDDNIFISSAPIGELKIFNAEEINQL